MDRILSILFIIVSPESALSNWHLKVLHSYLLHYNKFVLLFDLTLCLSVSFSALQIPRGHDLHVFCLLLPQYALQNTWYVIYDK